MIDFFMIVYILLCVVIGGYAVSSLYNRQQTIGAMLSLVLLILVFTFYGLRWFQGGALKGTQANANKTWPPIVNLCPDFMVTYKKDGNTYCYDVNNTYNLRTGTGAAENGLTDLGTVGGITGSRGYMIRRSTGTGTTVAAPNAQRLKDDTGTTATTYKFPLLKTLQTSAQTILGSTQGRWLRWEGVWDGRNLKPEAAPLVLS